MAAANQVKEQSGRRPPMPEFLFKLVNPLMKALLLSPLHGNLSKRLMVLTFTGRKSGKRFSTPVGYVLEGKHVFVFTHSPWRKNFTGGKKVTMRIRGQEYSGRGELVKDPERIRHILGALMRNNGEDMSRRMGFYVENLDTASSEGISSSTKGTYFIDITLESAIP